MANNCKISYTSAIFKYDTQIYAFYKFWWELYVI